MAEKSKQSYHRRTMSEQEIRELADSDKRLNIRLTNDFAFKTTFHNKVALTGLLSALLDIDPAEIRELELKDTTLAREYSEDKEGIVDVKILMNGDRKTHRLYSDKMSLRVLQLSQLSRAIPEEQETEIYAWAQMISANDWEVLRKMAERNEYMKAAVDEMEKINAEKEMRYRYLQREKWEHDEATIRFFEREQGVVQGKTEDILEFLEELGDVPEKLRKLISEQHDIETLKKWLKLAAKADSLEEFQQKILEK